jgi:hypothetical protein
MPYPKSRRTSSAERWTSGLTDCTEESSRPSMGENSDVGMMETL